MEISMVGTLCHAAAAVSAFLSALLVRQAARGQPKRLILGAYEELRGYLRTRDAYNGWLERREAYLIKNGAAFHFGSWVNPTRFLCLQIALSATGAIVLATFGAGYGILAAFLLWFAPDALVLYFNRQDNQALLPEIKLIYQALELQIRAGVYVTDALAECCTSVRQPRLYAALLELAGDIVVKADILHALEQLQEKFDNREIDALCIILIQACESGQATELLRDVGEQLKDMELTLLKQQKGALDRKLTFYQLGILAAVLGVILYACVTYMFQAAVYF